TTSRSFPPADRSLPVASSSAPVLGSDLSANLKRRLYTLSYITPLILVSHFNADSKSWHRGCRCSYCPWCARYARHRPLWLTAAHARTFPRSAVPDFLRLLRDQDRYVPRYATGSKRHCSMDGTRGPIPTIL